MKLARKVGGESKSSDFAGLYALLACLPLLLSVVAVCAELSQSGHASPRFPRTTSSALPALTEAGLSRQRNFTAQNASGSIRDIFATVVEQSIGQYSRYVIHVYDSSGVDESIPVTAPPGGLVVEIRDMTGDKVWNDLVLRPALFQASLGVLLNDGRDHFTTAVSAALPGSLDTRQHRASSTGQIQELAAPNSSRSRIAGPSHSQWFVVPQLQAENLSLGARAFPAGPGISNLLGRAPPAPIAEI